MIPQALTLKQFFKDDDQPKCPHCARIMHILVLYMKEVKEYKHHFLITEANNGLPQCHLICHCGPGTAATCIDCGLDGPLSENVRVR